MLMLTIIRRRDPPLDGVRDPKVPRQLQILASPERDGFFAFNAATISGTSFRQLALNDAIAQPGNAANEHRGG